MDQKRVDQADQLGTMNRVEGPETLPATNMGLTGMTWTDWTSAETGSSGTDVIGPRMVQNCVEDAGAATD